MFDAEGVWNVMLSCTLNHSDCCFVIMNVDSIHLQNDITGLNARLCSNVFGIDTENFYAIGTPPLAVAFCSPWTPAGYAHTHTFAAMSNA